MYKKLAFKRSRLSRPRGIWFEEELMHMGYRRGRVSSQMSKGFIRDEVRYQESRSFKIEQQFNRR